MKIAVWYNLPTGGAKRALYDHVSGLLSLGHEVVAFRPPVVKADWLPLPCPEQEVALDLQVDGSNYFQRILKHLLRPTLAMKQMQAHSQEVARLIEEGGFDVVFANTCCQYHSPFLGRYLRIPKLLYLQEPNRFLYEALPRLAWIDAPKGASWRRKLRTWFDLVALRQQAMAELTNAQSYDRILVNSYFSRESVARCYGLDSTVCYLGIDLGRLGAGSEPRENYLLGVGACVYPKRVKLAIEAVGQLAEPRPKLIWSANFIDDPYAAECRELAQRLGVDFELRELVPDDDLLILMQRAACVLYVPRLEPFGYVPLEAAACGASVVTVMEGGVRETMSEIGYLADPTPESIAQQICRVLADPVAARQKALANLPGIHAQWGLAAATDRLEAHLLEITRRP